MIYERDRRGASAVGFRPLVVIRGGGDLATGVAARLHRAGIAVVVVELAEPRAVRRLVAVAEAIYAGRVAIEDLVAVRAADTSGALQALAEGQIPVLVDAEARALSELSPDVLVDARMRKRPPELGVAAAPLVVGLGPGFKAGVDCHAVVETQRGHHLGRVLWQGEAASDTGVPEPVAGMAGERVLRAPTDGVLKGMAMLGSSLRRGTEIARVDDAVVTAPFDGVLRGLLHDGLRVRRGEKIGDLDPRSIPNLARDISDKALAVGGGVLEAVLSRPSIRQQLAQADASV